MNNLNINPELTNNRPTHIFNGVAVKIFPSTKHGFTVTGEIMEGEDKGKWTTVDLLKAEKGCFWEDTRFGLCRQCWECREHYR